MSQENIISAEMTVYWRSLFPQLSKDTVSVKLATEQGIIKAKEFEKRFSYALVGRILSIRAGFILETAKSALKTREYDSCISIASGFSLLTYLKACEVLLELPDTFLLI